MNIKYCVSGLCIHSTKLLRIILECTPTCKRYFGIKQSVKSHKQQPHTSWVYHGIRKHSKEVVYTYHRGNYTVCVHTNSRIAYQHSSQTISLSVSHTRLQRNKSIFMAHGGKRFFPRRIGFRLFL